MPPTEEPLGPLDPAQGLFVLGGHIVALRALFAGLGHVKAPVGFIVRYYTIGYDPIGINRDVIYPSGLDDLVRKITIGHAFLDHVEYFLFDNLMGHVKSPLWIFVPKAP